MEEASSLAREMALARPAMPAPTMRMSRGTGVGCIMIAWGWESVTAAESCFIPLAGVGEYNRILIAQPLRGGYKSHKSHRHGDGGGSDSQTMVHLGGPEMLIRDVCLLRNYSQGGDGNCGCAILQNCKLDRQTLFGQNGKRNGLMTPRSPPAETVNPSQSNADRESAGLHDDRARPGHRL